MKNRTKTLSMAAAQLASSLLVFGDPADYRNDRENPALGNPDASGSSGQRLRNETLGPSVKWSKMVGSPIRNLQEEALGNVHDLAVDVESGRVVEVIASVGSFLGVEDKLVAVPPAAFSRQGQQALKLDAGKTRLNASRTVNPDKWEENPQLADLTRVYRIRRDSLLS